MIRTDSDIFLLYIEPKKEQKSATPVEDDLSRIVDLALSKATRGTSNYHRPSEPPKFKRGGGFMGTHKTECGQKSTNNDFLLENGMVTNSLASYYVKWYRESIPATEMEKLKKLLEYYKHNEKDTQSSNSK